ncbi:MAG: hypothetical protein APF80_10815 [Alphaproteobacteria bacterium BRH_c36]|nr:MAG: hypothetical protein APF80_10815 [Alphaproteobacteria bacterium BRH_c36]
MIRASVLPALQAYVEKQGMDFQALLEDVAMNKDVLLKPFEFVPLAAVGQLFERAALLAKDDCMGLRIGAQMKGGKTGLLGHLAMTAPTARDALCVLAGYVNVLFTNIDSGYDENYIDGLSTAYWRFPESVSQRRQLNMFIAASVIQRLRDAMDSDWHPIRVDLEHRRPRGCPKCSGRGCEDCDAVVRGIVGGRVNFDRPINRIIHNTSALKCPMRTSDPMAFALHLDHARRELTDLTISEQLAHSVRTQIAEKLRFHDANLQSVADALDLPVRTLQNQLSQRGTNFETLVAEVREQVARRLLRETDMAITDIAYELGYADPSVFSRAARRWFNESPRDFRMRHRP